MELMLEGASRQKQQGQEEKEDKVKGEQEGKKGQVEI